MGRRQEGEPQLSPGRRSALGLYNWLQNGGFTWHKCCFINQSNESYHEKVVTQPSFSAVRCKTHVK